MSSASRATNSANPSSAQSTADKSLFEQQRDALLSEIAISLEHVLQNINKLNRNLEGVTAVGNEFSSVEALWSQFESVMARDAEVDPEPDKVEGRQGDEEDRGNHDRTAEESGFEEAEPTMKPSRAS